MKETVMGVSLFQQNPLIQPILLQAGKTRIDYLLCKVQMGPKVGCVGEQNTQKNVFQKISVRL